MNDGVSNLAGVLPGRMNRSSRRWLLLISIVAIVHALLFIWYQQPDWTTQWTDQEGYRRLGQVLANTGKFTRYPESPTFVPEVIRTPGYPLFVAAIYRLFGPSQLAVALAQAILFAAICLGVFRLGRRVTAAETALAAAAVTALYAPLPYFGALVLTEIWTALLFTIAMLLTVRAARRHDAAIFAAAGVLWGATALSRPVFFLFPVALAMVGTILLPLFRVNPRPSATRWALLVAASAVTLLPWFTYNYVTLGRFTMSPAGGIGRGTWEGAWQAVWSGRLQSELTSIAETAPDRTTLDARVKALAEREGLDAHPMLEYVHQWTDIRRIWVEPIDPHERTAARIRADDEYRRAALEQLRQQSPRHIARRLARGVFILWAGEIPFRYSTINALPPLIIRAIWLAQAVLMAMALYGLIVLARNGWLLEACLLGAPILYITAVHLPLLTEARQSLPAKPIVILLATIGARHLLPALFALKPQVHVRQHL